MADKEGSPSNPNQEDRFQLVFDDDAVKNSQLEVWALNKFLSHIPIGTSEDWRGSPQKSERPNFLIRRADGTNLGIELALYADEAVMSEQARRAKVRNHVIRLFDRNADREERLHLRIV